MHTKVIKFCFTGLLCVIMFSTGMSQRTAVFDPPLSVYLSAVELFHKQKYGAAQEQFREVLSYSEGLPSRMEANASYYLAICAVELFHGDAEELLLSFINTHPEHTFVRAAYFQLGRLKYRDRSYREAIRYFRLVDIHDLDMNERDEYHFKIGYSLFMTDQQGEAQTYLANLTQRDNVYFGPANYYYGHIAYELGNYETALQSFNRILDNERFNPILPYYITQIYYKQERYQQLLEVAPGLLEQATDRRKPEIARMIGDAYYKKNRFEEAIPYLETYQQSARRSLTRDDLYQLGYAYYRADNCQKAIEYLGRTTRERDQMGQNAHYHMAACYLKTGEYKFAHNAFQSAYRINANPEITQEALFNYAKLSYDMGYDPYNQAISAFQKYIRQYPGSPRIDEANRFLVMLFLSTKNYQRALEALDQIEEKTTQLRQAYQQIAYSLGVELFNNGQLSQAIEKFQASGKYDFNKEITAQALFWTAEAQYRKGQYQKAVQNFEQFQITAGAYRLPIYNMANYHIGYAHFKLNNYSQALTAFRKFVDQEPEENKDIITDAILRSGDCFYVQRRYNEAIQKYDQAITLGTRDIDYAYYQKAIAQGVTNNLKGKAQSLKQLVNQMPESAYADEATWELANTFLLLDNNQKALQYFNHLISEYPNSSRFVPSMQRKGLVYYNTSNYDLAINTFKDIRNQFPGTQESKEALVSIRNIYTNMGRVEEFFQYARDNAISLTPGEQDSVKYNAALTMYTNNDCEQAVPQFQEYLRQFPQGIFTLNAHYYLADCLFRQGNKDQAANHYQELADASMTRFKEEAVHRLAGIRYGQEKYEDAIEYYSILKRMTSSKTTIREALKWTMRSHVKMDNHQKAISAARQLIKAEKVPPEQIDEGYMTMGKAAMSLDSTSLARAAFDQLTKSLDNETSVEAQYLTAKIEYQYNNLDKAESLLFEIINNVPSYDFWIARSFILIADIYHKRENIVQAKATLQSIIDNYEVDPLSTRPNLVEVAREKLEDIVREDKEEEKPIQEEEEVLDYFGEEAAKLFDKEERDTEEGDTEQRDTEDELEDKERE